MTDREKVVKGLESLMDVCNAKADMAVGEGRTVWAGYASVAYCALALLREQEPRVMTHEEVMSTGPEDVCGIVEIIEEERMYGCYMRRYDEEHVELLCDVLNLPEKLQKGCARIWTARPTEEQRKAVKWNEPYAVE